MQIVLQDTMLLDTLLLDSNLVKYKVCKEPTKWDKKNFFLVLINIVTLLAVQENIEYI